MRTHFVINNEARCIGCGQVELGSSDECSHVCVHCALDPDEANEVLASYHAER